MEYKTGTIGGKVTHYLAPLTIKGVFHGYMTICGAASGHRLNANGIVTGAPVTCKACSKKITSP